MKNSLRIQYRNLRNDDKYRAEVLLCLSLFMNIAFAFFNVFCGWYMHSAWLGTMAFYYILLGIMRYLLVKDTKQEDEIAQWKRFKRSGDLLLVLTIALVGMSILLQSGAKTIKYPGHTIYAVACYSFYAVGSAVWNTHKYRKLKEPISLAGKMINLAVATISMFSLQSAMTATFGKDKEFSRFMGVTTGLGVFVLICLIALYMIYIGKREIRNRRDMLIL